MFDVKVGTKLKLFSGKEVTVKDIHVKLDGIFIVYVKYVGVTEEGEEITFTATAILDTVKQGN